MDVKRLLKQPLSDVTAQELGLSAELTAQLSTISADYRQALANLKTARDKKRAVASQFKHVKDSPGDMAALKQQMVVESSTVNELELTLKALTTKAISLLDEHKAPKQPAIPSQLIAPAKQLNKPLEFEWLSPTDKRWEAFVAQSESGVNLYHRSAIHQSISAAFQHETEVLVAQHKGEIVGGLPLTLVKSRLFGCNLVSVPYFNYAGPLSPYTDVETELLSQAKKAMSEKGAEQLEVRTTRSGLASEGVLSKKVSMILPLPSSDEALESQLSAKVRAQYKKALEASPEIKFGGKELLDDFYKVFATNMRDLGTPVYSKAWFRSLLDNSDLQTTLVICYLNDKPSACGFLLGHNDMLEIPWASTLRAANKANLNMWMYRQILCFAIEQGYQFFDFGRSTKNATTYRFKKQWGAQEVPHYWYYHRLDGEEVGGANPDNPKYRLMIAVWQKLPVWLTKLIGPPIVAQIP